MTGLQALQLRAQFEEIGNQLTLTDGVFLATEMLAKKEAEFVREASACTQACAGAEMGLTQLAALGVAGLTQWVYEIVKPEKEAGSWGDVAEAKLAAVIKPVLMLPDAVLFIGQQVMQGYEVAAAGNAYDGARLITSSLGSVALLSGGVRMMNGATKLGGAIKFDAIPSGGYGTATATFGATVDGLGVTTAGSEFGTAVLHMSAASTGTSGRAKKPGAQKTDPKTQLVDPKIREELRSTAPLAGLETVHALDAALSQYLLTPYGLVANMRIAFKGFLQNRNSALSRYVDYHFNRITRGGDRAGAAQRLNSLRANPLAGGSRTLQRHNTGH